MSVFIESFREFGMRRIMLTHDIAAIEQSLGLSLSSVPDKDAGADPEYYAQFEHSIRTEASEMARHYQVFYCLEKSIRRIVIEVLKTAFGSDWWDTKVPENVRKNADDNRRRELESAVTPRSSEPIDYTTFGELGEIVRANWDLFSDIFNNQRAFTRVMSALNMLRGPIAHCSPLAADEVDRLSLTLRDWFRLME